MKRLLCLTLWLLLPSTLTAAMRVLEIHPPAKTVVLLLEGKKRWHVREQVCVMRDDSPVLCGQITQITKFRATVLLHRGADRNVVRALEQGGSLAFVEMLFGVEKAHKSQAVRALAARDLNPKRTVAGAPVSLSNDLLIDLREHLTPRF